MATHHHRQRTRTLAWLLVLLAGLLTANSLLGPLALEVIDYRYSDSLINQGIGLDAVALTGAVPIALVAARLLARGHLAGPVLALIPATFAAYMAPQYIVGPEYLNLPGNNERFFVFHLALFIAGMSVAVLAWRSIDPETLRPSADDSDRRRSLVLLGVIAFILAGRWLGGVIDLLGGYPTSTDYLENPTAFLLIGVLDLGVVVPAAAATAIALWRHLPWARTAAYAVIGWFALVPAAVAAMAMVMTINDDPNASAPATVIFVVAAAVFTFGAAALYRPIFQPTGRTQQPRESDPEQPLSGYRTAEQGATR
ncbi:MAG: hypothetical protein KDB24_10480 [Microthrixaceae bacterium]|nr:hypothetical protein [Microthrixaceae bacterium]